MITDAHIRIWRHTIGMTTTRTQRRVEASKARQRRRGQPLTQAQRERNTRGRALCEAMLRSYQAYREDQRTGDEDP